MRFTTTIHALALIVPTLSAAQSPEGGEPLDPYISCQYSGGLSPVSITRLPGRGVRHRTVQTASGEKRISVADGYTVLLGQGEPGYFANIKFEKSDPSQYARDKDAVIKSFELASQSALAQKRGVWEHMPFNGFDVYGLNDPTMDDNGPNGMYVLFRDSTQTIVTIYLLGQKPEHRKFKTIDERNAVVDQMLMELTTCGNRPVLAAIARDTRRLRTADDVDAFINRYYLQPRPDRIADLIRAVSSSGVLRIPEAVPSITGFLSEVFAANPARVAEWQQVISQQPVAVTVVLGQALSLSKAGGLLQLEQRSMDGLNMYWGAFFASGNPAFVLRILGLVPFAGERNDLALFQTGSVAKLSLALNARKHAQVRSILEDARRIADQQTQETITEVLTHDPSRIRKEMFDIHRKQKRAGKWK